MFSPIAGLLVSAYGPQALFNASFVAGILGVLPTAMLPTYALKNKRRPLAIDPEPVAGAESAVRMPNDEAAGHCRFQNGCAAHLI